MSFERVENRGAGVSFRNLAEKQRANRLEMSAKIFLPGLFAIRGVTAARIDKRV